MIMQPSEGAPIRQLQDVEEKENIRASSAAVEPLQGMVCPPVSQVKPSQTEQKTRGSSCLDSSNRRQQHPQTLFDKIVMNGSKQEYYIYEGRIYIKMNEHLTPLKCYPVSTVFTNVRVLSTVGRNTVLTRYYS